MKTILNHTLSKNSQIAPLAVFRFVFGLIMFISMIRFMANGWVHDLYIEPKLFFPYYGFEWIKPFSGIGMYILFTTLSIAFLFQALGLFYRVSSAFTFLAFTYIELIDKTNYLNHYYFVSIVCLILIFLPAHRYFSMDVKRGAVSEKTHVPNWIPLILKLQLAIVYFYAGLAKLNPEWLFEAMPLKIWLPTKANLPIIGDFLKQEWLAYAFSWGGAIYDLSIPFLLFSNRYRSFAYFLVIVFHLLTYSLFNIGMFPFIMIGATLIFFTEGQHQKWITHLNKFLPLLKAKQGNQEAQNWTLNPSFRRLIASVLMLFFLIQLSLPFRFLVYPGSLFWNEEGYRFSWRVMLMEKAGYAIFHIKDPESGRSWEVNNYDFLSPNQEKMMSTQADMILQFAHYLDDYYQAEGIEDPIVTVESYVSLNGSPSSLYIDSTIDLSKVQESFEHKEWILKRPEVKNEK